MRQSRGSKMRVGGDEKGVSFFSHSFLPYSLGWCNSPLRAFRDRLQIIIIWRTAVNESASSAHITIIIIIIIIFPSPSPSFLLGSRWIFRALKPKIPFLILSLIQIIVRKVTRLQKPNRFLCSILFSLPFRLLVCTMWILFLFKTFNVIHSQGSWHSRQLIVD